MICIYSIQIRIVLVDLALHLYFWMRMILEKLHRTGMLLIMKKGRLEIMKAYI